MISFLWRFFSALLDWRLLFRRLSGEPAVDVAFITNIRDSVDKKRFLGKCNPKNGHFNGPRYYVNGTAGRTRALNSLTSDLFFGKSRLKAKAQFLRAVEWAEKRGARVILLAAGTKRLFRDEELNELKDSYPHILFTIGDNGTAYLLQQETLSALQKSGLPPDNSRIGVLGPSGFLGKLIIDRLTQLHYRVVGMTNSQRHLDEVVNKFGIEMATTFEDMGNVDAVIACTHSNNAKLTAESIPYIRRDNKKLLVVDVAEPSNFTEEEYNKCSDYVIRQDAGNAYSKKLHYGLGCVTYNMFRLHRGVTFGCFAEALVLAKKIKEDFKLKGIDWIGVDQNKIDLIGELFKEEEFATPNHPYCFHKKVKDFNLGF